MDPSQTTLTKTETKFKTTECALCGCDRVFTLTGGVDKNVPMCVQCDETINERLSRRSAPPPPPHEEELKCCGCDRPMEGEEDFGNNADVADTCCEECFNAHLEEEDEEDENWGEDFWCLRCSRQFRSWDGEECVHCGYCPRLDGEVKPEEDE